MEGAVAGVPMMYVNVKVKRRGGDKSAAPPAALGVPLTFRKAGNARSAALLKPAVVGAALYSNKDASLCGTPPPPPLNPESGAGALLVICSGGGFRSALPGEVLSPELLAVT